VAHNERIGRHLIAFAILLTGCSGGTPAVSSSAELTTTTPSVAAAALDELLLSAAEVNTAMGTRSMTVAGTWTTMLDASSHIPDKDCVFAYPADNSVYVVSNWTAVRRQILDQPGGHSTHEVTQAVVSFPSAEDAARFFASSAEHWPACANRQYRHTSPDDPDVVWSAGPLADADGTLSVTDTRQGTKTWACQRALTVNSNIAVDIAACVPGNPADIAVNIAHQIAAKVARQ